MASDTSHLNRIVRFTEMKDGTREDYELLELHERDYLRTLPDRVVSAVKALETGLGGYPVTRLEHSLQAATRAKRDGADTEMIVAALIHDMGDDVAPFNHAGIASAVLRPYVRPEVTWIVEQHGLFQSYYYLHHLGGDREGREKYRDHRWYQACKDFCANWDQSSFDPSYRAEPLESFVPLVREVFTRKAYDPRFVGVGTG
jgi:predicted HD phosphohydrolase